MNFKFKKIKYYNSSDGFLNLIFFNEPGMEILHFDGYTCFRRKSINQDDYTYLKYNKDNIDMFIRKITRLDEVFFFEINNGDILQISQIYDAVIMPQILSIYETSDIEYPIAVKTLNHGEEVEIEQE